MTQVVALILAEHHTVRAEKAGGTDFPILGPACGTVGGDVLCLPRPDDRHEDGGGDGDEAARRRDERAFDEDRRRIGIEREPPPKEGRRIVDRPAGQIEPRVAELRLEAEAEGNPLRRGPGHYQDNGEDDGDLAPEYSASTHKGSNRQKRWSRSENRHLRERQQERWRGRAAGYYQRQIG